MRCPCILLIIRFFLVILVRNFDSDSVTGTLKRLHQIFINSSFRSEDVKVRASDTDDPSSY